MDLPPKHNQFKFKLRFKLAAAGSSVRMKGKVKLNGVILSQAEKKVPRKSDSTQSGSAEAPKMGA